ncbi:MAG: RNA-binding S4 domain-containing protein [Pseudomonadota bacterium]
MRLDKWLFYTRVYKTRSLAAKACNGGLVHVNGERVRASRDLGAGDVLDISKGHLHYRYTVVSEPTRRGPASEARLCYSEDAAVAEQRDKDLALRKAARASTPTTQGRPDRKTRRALVSRKQGFDS